MDSLNKKPVISDLIPLTYSMLINQDKKNKTTVLHLEKLVTNFKLDITLKNNVSEIKSIPAFISKSYYQIQNLDKPDKSDFSYNYPPKGPIESNFMCQYCEKEGPSYHTESCRRPFNTSLILINETSKYPGAEVGTSYDLLVKKSGQKKIVSKRARSQMFTDNVEIFYQNENEQQTVIRISRNGTINIISASMNDTELPDLVVYRINQINGAVVSPPFTIKEKYKYLISAQCNIFPEKFNKELLINLNTLNSNLWNIPLFKKKVQNKDVFMLTRSEYFFVSKYNYNSGEQFSKSNKITNPFIQFTLISPTHPDIKTSVMIYIRGAVQLRSSYVNTENRSKPLEYSILQNVYTFLKELLTQIIIYSHEANFDIITTEIKPTKKSKIPNMVDGGQPKTCHNRAGSVAGSGDFRPVPYSFYGVCPMEGYYVPPRGNKRPDGKFEPCCKKLKDSGQDSKTRYNNMILNGYPDGLYDETVTPDDSAVFVPGTKIIEPRSFPGLRNMPDDQLMSCMENSGYIRKSNVFDKEYNNFKVSANVPKLTFKKYKSLLQLDTFTKNAYMVTPIHNDTLRVKLYFNSLGNSYFVNTFNDISESGIPTMRELAETEIEGYLHPFPDNFIFYPVDISKIHGTDVSQFDFYSGTKKRWEYLKSAVSKIETKQISIKIEINFDLNIVQGSNYFLTNFSEISGLLFIPHTGNEIRVWSDSLHDSNKFIGLSVKKIKGNRWKITVENKTIPQELVQQGSENDIEIPISFTKDKPDEMFVLFKINLKRTDFKIENRKPFIPIEQLEHQINNYSEVINILESIKNPISREVFTTLHENPLGFMFNNKLYYLTTMNAPLTQRNLTN